jgi:NAD(P)H dehydrogenase (quinone)
MRVLLVYAHPCEDSFVAGVLAAAVRGLEAGGHLVERRDLNAEGFSPELTEGEWRDHPDHPDPRADVADHQLALERAEALVLVYPTWWGAQPAILKGWFDRVWAAGGRFPNVRRVVAVTTHGSPKWINVLQGEAGKRLVGRVLRGATRWWARPRWIALYGVDGSDALTRGRFLAEVEQKLARPRL